MAGWKVQRGNYLLWYGDSIKILLTGKVFETMLYIGYIFLISINSRQIGLDSVQCFADGKGVFQHGSASRKDKN